MSDAEAVSDASDSPVLPFVDDVFSIKGRSWFVLVTAPQAENKIAERTEHLGNPVYVPVARTFRPDKVGRVLNHVAERPLMPGYAFVNLPNKGAPFAAYVDDEPVGLPACHTAGYAFPASSGLPIGGLSFVSDNGRPRPLAPGVIEDLKAREAAGEFDDTGTTDDGRYVIPKWLKRAGSVRITAGPFIGFCGSISRVLNSNIVSVWISIFRRTSLIDMPIAFIEKSR